MIGRGSRRRGGGGVLGPADHGLLAASVDGAEEAGISECSCDGAHRSESICKSDEIEEEKGEERDLVMGFVGNFCHGWVILKW